MEIPDFVNNESMKIIIDLKIDLYKFMSFDITQFNKSDYFNDQYKKQYEML